MLLTGKLQQLERVDAKDRLQRLGATLTDRVEDSPDFVIAGQKGGRAVFVAKQESIPVLDEATLMAILDKAVADGVLRLAQENEVAPGPPDLSGASLAFTGRFPDVDLKDLKRRLGERGVTIHPGITVDTQYVVVGENPASMKLFRAKQLGIAQLGAADVQAFLDS